MMWDNGGQVIFSNVIADCPYSDDGTCDGCTQGMHGGCYYG